LSRLIRSTLLLGGLVFAVSALIACGGDDESPEEASANLCEDIDAFESTLASFSPQGGGSTTTGELRDLRDELAADLEAVQDSAGDLEQSLIDDLEDAYSDLDAAVEDVSDDATLAEAQASTTEERAGVEAAWRQVASAARCP
jgi:hypothetical protein